MGPGTGNQFSSDDVGNCLSDLCFPQFLTFYMQRGDISSRFVAFFGVKMSDTDEYMSSDTISSMQDESDSDEIEVVGLVEPYANEPPAHSSDDDEDDEEDADGLSPAVLRARFERQLAVNEWLVIFLRSNFRILSHLLCNFFPTLLRTKHKHMYREPKEPRKSVADYSITMCSLLCGLKSEAKIHKICTVFRFGSPK